MAGAASPVATSTVRSALGIVEIGFIAARTRSTSPVDMPPSVPPDLPDVRSRPGLPRDDLVLRLRPANGRETEAVAHLDALDGLDPHQRGSEARVQPTVPVHMAAEARREPVGQHLDDAAEGVALAMRIGDLGLHGRAAATESRQRTGLSSMAARSDGTGTGASAPTAAAADAHDMAEDLDARTPAAGRPCATAASATRAAVSRALARSRIGRASVKPYFCMPTRSAWPGRGRVSGALRARAAIADLIDRVGRHDLLPLRPLGVAHLDGHRTAEGAPVADAAQDADLVTLELHAGPAPGPEPTAREVVRDLGGPHLDTGRQALGDRDEGRAVRLTCGQPAHHGPNTSRGR